MIFSVFQKLWFFGYSWSTLLWYRCYYPHWSRDALSPVCRIFSYVGRNIHGHCDWTFYLGWILYCLTLLFWAILYSPLSCCIPIYFSSPSIIKVWFSLKGHGRWISSGSTYLTAFYQDSICVRLTPPPAFIRVLFTLMRSINFGTPIFCTDLKALPKVFNQPAVTTRLQEVTVDCRM